MIQRVLLSAACAALAAVSSAADTPHVTLAYKAQAGQVVRYQSKGTFTMEGGGQKVTVERTEVEKVLFKEVAASGDISMERKTESSESTVNGNKEPDENDESITTVTIHPDGTLAAFKHAATGDTDDSAFEARVFVASTPVFTNHPIAVGEKWTKEYAADASLGLKAAKATVEVTGLEQRSGVDTAKVKMDYTETEGSKPLTIKSVTWVEVSSGDTVAADYDVQNLVPSDDPNAPTINGTEHEERIEGAPLSGAKTTPPNTIAKADDKKPGDKGAAVTVKVEEKKPEPKKDKTIDEVVKDYEKLPGYFTLYRKKENGRDTIYLELKESQLNQLLMLQATASTGDSDHVVAGDPISDTVFKLTKIDDDRLFMIVPNIRFRVNENTPIGRAVKRSFADAIIEQFRIEAKQPDRKSLLINISDLFRGDIAGVSQLFMPNPLMSMLGLGGSGMFGMDPMKTYIASIKNFPDNLVVETAYNFMGRIGGYSDVLADTRSVPIKVEYNLYALPDDGYKPRLADPRVGFFQTEYQDMNNDRDRDRTTRFINRWNVEKANPKLAMSPPKKAIEFWLDNAIPVEYRDACREGVLMWNKAFEAIGIKDAIVVKQMPDNADWDHADLRHNVIRWVASTDAGYAVTQERVNPITGEILNGNITVDSNFVRYIKLEHKDAIDPTAMFAEPDAKAAASLNRMRCEFGKGMMEQAWFGRIALEMLAPAGMGIDDKAYLHSYLREVVCHEFGHMLGLRHNFVASTYHNDKELADESVIAKTGISSSVMEYGPFNVFALRHKGVEFYSPTVGPYDMWAVSYGYTPIDSKTPQGEMYKLSAIASECNEPGHQYESDEQADSWDPNITRFDLGKDPLVYWNKMLDVSRFLALNAGKRLPKQGDSYVEFTHNFMGMLNMYTRSAAMACRFVGGLNLNRNHKGDPGERPTLVPVPADEQARALAVLNQYVFSESAWTFPSSYYTHMIDEPDTFLPGTFPIRDMVSSVQVAALRRIFSPAVLDRVVNNEYKLNDPAHSLTLVKVFQSVNDNIWSELAAQHSINTLRRQLQRADLDMLISLYMNPQFGVPEDAKMLAWDELKQLKARLAAVKTDKCDAYTRIHVQESLARVTRALDAKETITVGTRG